MELCYKKSKDGIYVQLKVIPKSSRDELLGVFDGRLKIAVRAVPQNNEANTAVVKVIAKLLNVKKSCCTIVSGCRSSRKTVFIADDVEAKIMVLDCGEKD